MTTAEITYWANEIKTGRAVMARLGPRGGWRIVPPDHPELARDGVEFWGYVGGEFIEQPDPKDDDGELS